MNIYALEGFKIIVTDRSIRNGSKSNSDLVRKHLAIGKEYTVKKTEVRSFSSKVELQEFSGIAFNPVNFIDVFSQNEEDDKKHPDWAKYH